MHRVWIVGPLFVVALNGCNSDGESLGFAETPESTAEGATMDASSSTVCAVEAPSTPLPDQISETSGLAQSRRDPERFWTHNDAGNDPEIFALDTDGRVVQRVRVAGAEAADWEDIESSQCESGACLFLADIGDNDGNRDQITIYRIPEPEAGRADSEPATALHARFPDRAQDAESLFGLPSGDLYIVTKGRQGAIALYRYPQPQASGGTVTLERIRELLPEPRSDDDRVTAATASPDGKWVGVRSNHTLYLYRTQQLIGDGSADPTVVDLRPLDQAQGESLAIAADGIIWLTSEATGKNNPASWARLRCSLPA